MSKTKQILQEMDRTLSGYLTHQGSGAGYSKIRFAAGTFEFEIQANKTFQQIIDGEDAAVQIRIRDP